MRTTSFRRWGVSAAIVSALLFAAVFSFLGISRRLRESVRRKQTGVIYL